MAKTATRPAPTVTHHLRPQRADCPHCGRPRRADYTNPSTLTALGGVIPLNLTARRCRNAACPAHLRAYRPESEGPFALPHHEFGLDVVALIGWFRSA
jgi:hypothetical protein